MAKGKQTQDQVNNYMSKPNIYDEMLHSCQNWASGMTLRVSMKTKDSVLLGNLAM